MLVLWLLKSATERMPHFSVGEFQNNWVITIKLLSVMQYFQIQKVNIYDIENGTFHICH